MTGLVCARAVQRGSWGVWQECGAPAVAVVEDLEFGEDFPVCAEHLAPTSGPLPGQFDLFGGEVGS